MPHAAALAAENAYYGTAKNAAISSKRKAPYMSGEQLKAKLVTSGALVEDRQAVQIPSRHRKKAN